MAYTTTDLANVEAAIIAIATGTRAVQVNIGNKSISYADADIDKLKILRSDIQADIQAALGSFRPRTYARQGGRGQ